ncbi:hypothetical protein IWQ60_006051 [Tieghemiomyces parasiticus]|uniref:Phosducin domain-containing protein n=1 Tax=Tieghemiomyces parasiticus TaxID=78921 RepID=A0A9W8AAM6_9FUNG|nr:hypothetical protein IWQ60_006051 [Tieghemiomyces parasiticus]
MASTPTDANIERLAYKGLEASSDLEEDALFEELENDSGVAAYREQRLDALKQQMAELQHMRSNDHGQYTEIFEEKAALDLMTSTDLCVLHFYHPDFRRCLIMDKHLQLLARKYFTTKFFKVNVSNVPFMVEKLKIRVLPCVIPVVNSVTVRRVVGFEELGNKDDFKTVQLEALLRRTGVLNSPKPPREADQPGDSSEEETDEDAYLEDDGVGGGSSSRRRNDGFLGKHHAQAAGNQRARNTSSDDEFA